MIVIKDAEWRNNRLWLIHRPTGQSVYLGKRMGEGWYDAPFDLGERLNALFADARHFGEYETQDDFVLAIEDPSGAPGCTGDWVYDEKHKPKLKAP